MLHRNSLSSLVPPALLAVAAFAACGDDAQPPPTPPAEMAICSGAIPAGAKPSLGVAAVGTSPASEPALDPALANSGACAETTTAISRAVAADIVPAGYTALGAAIRFAAPDGTKLPHGVDLVVPCDLSKAPAGTPGWRIVVVEKRDNGAVVVTPVTNVVYEDYYHRLHLHGDEMGTYQCAVPAGTGRTFARKYNYRAIAGVSMGGIGSSLNFWSHPDRYDAIAVMGADPGPDVTYMMGFMRDWFFGGFCTADDEKAGRGKVGALCAPARKPMADQFEIPFEFEKLHYQKGDGVGLTLRRSTYTRAFRDLSRAFGNAAYATAGSGPSATYLPPGVPLETLDLAPADACDPKKATVLTNFYDRRYNPAGERPVITFCDGGDGGSMGLGMFDPAQPQLDPTQILLAVDVNGNGRRDSGEPVVVQISEPFSDVGADGLADKDEPGYDPAKNPDPNHDDFHWLHNPGGTENNWRWDKGEPFDDSGVDGVAGKGCEVGSKAGCYDYGEGNKKFDYNPNVARWFGHDPHTLAETLPAETFDRVAIYYDAGIHDFLNAHVATNTLFAALHARGQHVRVWDGFPLIAGARYAEDIKFNAGAVDYARLGRRLYVRYGNPDLTGEQVENTGDGRHVGSILQAAQRAQVLFYFVSNAWADGDTDVTGDLSGDMQIDASFVTKSGRKTAYSVVLPPGYASGDKRYPVIYLLHGYGMDPKGMAGTVAIAHSAMVDDRVPPERRMKKFIVVTVDGQCNPGGDVKSAPLAKQGDLCEEGTFYTNHPDGTALAEDQIVELQELIESKYRVRAPETRMVTE